MERGWSQRRLAEKLNDASGHPTNTRHDVYRWENGKRSPRSWLPVLAEVFALPLETFESAGAASNPRTPDEIIDLIDGTDDEAMRRRALLACLMSWPALAGIEGSVALEGLRHELNRASGASRHSRHRDSEEWDEIAWEYGTSYATVSPPDLLRSLTVDLQRLNW
jgi:transcriptional regulator with XRE-family HTH domain